MRLALSEISTIGASFADDVAAYAAAGFDAIGIWEFKLPPDDDANLALLRRHGLDVANCVPAVPSVLQLGIPGMEGPAGPEERIEAICASVRRLARYEPESVLCLTGPRGTRSGEEARQIVTDGLRRVAAVAAEAGVRLGLEPTHPSQHETTGFVNTLDEALVLLDEARLPHVGVMADTFNLAGEDPRTLAAAAGRITGLHVAEVPSEPGRQDRDLPGARARAVVTALRDAQWDGSLDVEIFSTPEGFWALPVAEAARRAYAAVSALRAAL
ncbi:MAG TPA: TIM barrel protein [Gaiellaceae bacterium]|nr:TIM barrel protein [Gaiellaceae bacterium]